MELGVLGPLQVRQYGLPVTIPGAKPRAVLTMLGLYGGSVVSADTLVELLWGVDPPRTAAKALQTHVSALRRTLGDGFVLTEGTGWTLSTTEIDASRYKLAVKKGREAVAAGDASRAVADFDEALNLWRGTPELPDGPRGVSEKTRWIEGHAALVEDRADALLATGRAAEIVGELEAAIADAPLRERRWGQLMLALYRAGRQGEALGAYQRARALLAEELGVDPGPDLRRLEAAIVAQDTALEMPVSQQLSAVTRAVTFLLTDIEGSTAAWEANADAMAVALARHDEIVEQVVTSRGGRLIKTRGEGDATFSVFERPSAAAAAAIELQEAIRHEPWALLVPMRIRVALHTGEVELRDGDYFGRAVNRAARLRSLAEGGQILCSGATAELVIDSLRDDVLLADLGMRHLKNLARPEHVFELRLQTDDSRAPTADSPIERPALPAVLAGPGPFVGRGLELERLRSAWQTALATGTGAVLIAGEPGVGKTRLAGEWCRQADDQGAVVLYGRCDEDLGAPYQPFAEALRSLVPCVGTKRLRGLRGVEALLPLVPALSDVLPDLAAPPRADPDTERYALFDAVVGLLGIASASAPVVLVLDDLHWAAKPTLLLLRHLLRFGEQARVQIVGTYRSTDLDRAHPLAAMLADLHRDGSADRLSLSGLDENDVTAYVAEAGYDDEELARALASVTGGNPFFLIEALRHVDESGGRWDPGTLPQGVREAVSRRLSRLPVETNKALAAAAVVGSRFAVDLVERVVDQDLVDAFDEACKAGILIEEPGGRYRFNHAIVRQSLLTELASVRRMRLHQRIAVTLETEPGADDELLAELAYHYFECAWAGNAAKAVDYCRRAADQAMARLAYEGAADLYDKALHALEELDEELPDRDDQLAELLIARCEALLAAGDVASARGAVAQLQAAAADSARLAAWGTCFDSELSMLTDPERLDEIESALAAAAAQLVGLEDSAGEAKAHTVRAGCLARLGRIGDAETALDQALTAARRAREHRRVNSVLANAPLAALWGPNPVPRAGGRCLDVVRLLRITTGSPVVEATSTRCQGVLDAFRGRAAAGRQLIDSARRSLTELGMRHALLEVDQFAGIVELVADDPVAAVPYLRRAYEGFRRMGLDADTAETAALLARACLALDRDVEADELCTESERLAGHALKASITWRTVRAQLLSRRGDHGDARRVAGEAVAIAERTDALVDHGDADLALAMVLGAAGDVTGARAAAEQAVALYERKGAAALAEKARKLTGATHVPAAPKPGEPPTAKLDNACARVIRAMHADFDREAFDEAEQMYAPNVFVESRRKIVGFALADVPSGDWPQVARHLREGWAWIRYPVIAVRGERLALTRIELGANDMSPGAPHEEFLGLWGLDEGGRIALQVFFDIDDLDAAMAELEAVHARIAEAHPRVTRLQNTASRVDDECYALFAAGRIEEIGALYADDIKVDDRRHGLRRETNNRTTAIDNVRAIAALGALVTNTPLALRGDRLCLSHIVFERRDAQPDGFKVETLELAEVNSDGLMVARVVFDVDDLDAAHEELNARYLAGEAAPYAEAWRTVMAGGDTLNRHEPGAMAQRIAVFADHRRIPFAADDIGHATDRLWALVPDARYRI
ncbi:MAG TPA: BTAD domain-containing putative transcriptional regulator, partial [Mycobacterium sp.]|nr:BTAD domain-containing putative transcriptional regulator [Mycobacterium sp.]